MKLVWRSSLAFLRIIARLILSGSQAFVSHPSRRCKYQWGECALLYFCDARVVFSLLFILKNPVDLLGAKVSIRVSIGMTHPYIKKYSPLSLLEAPKVDVKACIGAWLVPLASSSPVIGCNAGSTLTS